MHSLIGRTAVVNPPPKIQLEPKDFSYGEGPWGSQRLRKAMAKFITHRFHPGIPVDPEHLLFANGVTALCEMLALSICDAGDGLLLSRPIYQAFKNDFGISAKFAFPFESI